jgi:hypothetical protein
VQREAEQGVEAHGALEVAHAQADMVDLRNVDHGAIIW